MESESERRLTDDGGVEKVEGSDSKNSESERRLTDDGGVEKVEGSDSKNSGSETRLPDDGVVEKGEGSDSKNSDSERRLTDDGVVEKGEGSGSKKSESDDFLCAICLESYDDRSFVKLICKHKFHLDCIGSFFNAKRRMECPICGVVENGDWRLADPPLSTYMVNSLRNDATGAPSRSPSRAPSRVPSQVPVHSNELDRLAAYSKYSYRHPARYVPAAVQVRGAPMSSAHSFPTTRSWPGSRVVVPSSQYRYYQHNPMRSIYEPRAAGYGSGSHPSSSRNWHPTHTSQERISSEHNPSEGSEAHQLADSFQDRLNIGSRSADKGNK